MILAHLGHRLKVSYCDHRMTIVHQSIFHQQFPLNNRSPKLLDRIPPYFTRNILGWSLSTLFKEFYSMQNSGCHSNQKEKSFKNLVKNYRSDFKIIWYKWASGDLLPKLFKLFRLVEKHGRQGVVSFSYVYIGKTLKIFLSKTARPRALIFGDGLLILANDLAIFCSF